MLQGDRLAAPVSGARPLVLAVVVTYNPGEELATHLAALRSQIPDVLVVDNASANIGTVREVALRTGCTLLVNDENRGIAAALNQGARVALDRGAAWLATFDQDSLLPPGSIERLLACHRAQPEADRYAIIAPAHRDRGTQTDYHHPLDIVAQTEEWRVLRATITSGSLIRCDVLAQVGLFDERLFIDAVDLDFCLRARRRGWLVGEARQVVMPHSIGASTAHRILGIRMVCTHHTPLRRYYITRNMLEVCLRHAMFDPVWAAKGLFIMSRGAVAAMVMEQDRSAKFRAVLAGLRDFGLRRFGPRHTTGAGAGASARQRAATGRGQ